MPKADRNSLDRAVAESESYVEEMDHHRAEISRLAVERRVLLQSAVDAHGAVPVAEALGIDRVRLRQILRAGETEAERAASAQQAPALAPYIAAGILQPGDLLHIQRRGGIRHEGVLAADGSIVVDGKSYRAPSTAASAAINGPADGWLRWRVYRLGGMTLAQLREEHPDIRPLS